MDQGCAPSDPEFALADVGWVRALARRLVSDPHAADDLAQDTWLAALRTSSGPRLGARAWLSGIARTLVQRRLRRSEPRPAGLMEEVGARASSPDELLAQADFQRRVLAAVTTLDEPYRTTVLLRYFEELSVEELSRRMGVPGSTGRTRLQRAHGLLRERLDGEYGERTAWSVFASAARRAPLAWKGAAIVGVQMKLVLVSAAAVVLGWMTWRSLREPSVRATPVQESHAAAPIASREEPRELAKEPAQAATREAVTETAAVSGTDAKTPDESEVAREVLERLRTAVESSVNGRVDPNAFLDAALLILQHEASDKAIPEPDVTGWMKFPIPDAPGGIEANLKVAPPSRNPNFAHVLSLEMNLPKGEGAYLIDGMPRRDVRADMTIWANPEDHLLHFTILTDLDVDGLEARQRGLLEDLTFTRSMHYHVDLDDPSKAGMTIGGFEHGRGPVDHDVPLVLDGGAPERERIERFGQRLLAMYAGIRRSGR